MGSTELDRTEQPVHEVTLSTYCIDKTEVTVHAFAGCAAAGVCRPAQRQVWWVGIQPDQVERFSPLCNGIDQSNHPMNCVTWDQAQE